MVEMQMGHVASWLSRQQHNIVIVTYISLVLIEHQLLNFSLPIFVAMIKSRELSSLFHLQPKQKLRQAI
jgi:hypothetical protein